MNIDFIGPAYAGRSKAIDSQRCINWYLETNMPNESREYKTLAPTGGVSLLVKPSGSPSRGEYSYNSMLFSVHGNTLYSITIPAGTATAVTTTLDTNSGTVSFADNGAQMMIVDGTSGYIFTKSTGNLVKITDVDFPANATHVVFLDSFFIVSSTGSGKFYKSALNDGTSWNSLEFATAEGFPDNIVSIAILHRRLWLFGDNSTEIWYNAGGQDFPFVRVQGSVVDEGVNAQWSVSQDRDNQFWLSKSERGDDMVMMSRGSGAVRISTMPIELDLDSYSDTADAIGFVFQEEGHTFYSLSFPAGGKTWVYDVSESLKIGFPSWHERSSSSGRWLGQYRAFVNKEHYVSDYRNGNIYKLDHDILSENGSDIIRTRAGRHITSGRDRVFLSSIEFVFEVGIGNSTVPDPTVMLRISKDGGFTWGRIKTASAGKVGEYLKRVKFNRLGMARDWVFEISVSDQVDWNLISANVE